MQSMISIYIPIIFLVMAGFFLTIGLKVLLTKRPFLLNSRYFFAFILLSFSPSFVNTFNWFSERVSSEISFIFYLNPLMLIVLLVFFWFQMKGYMMVGISDDSFRDGLHFSLKKNGYEFEEKLSLIELSSLGAVLQVSVQSWIGMGQLKLKKSNDSSVLKKIINGLNEFYQNNSTKPNNVTSFFFIIMGVFMLALSIGMFVLSHQLLTKG